MTTSLTIAANATVAKLINADKDVKRIVSDLLSYIVEGAEFTFVFKNSGWDGRSSFFVSESSSFPAGFVHLVHGDLTRRGYKVQIVKKPLPEPKGPENPIVDEFGNDDPRYDYQMRAVRQVEKHGRGIIQVATGGGKSKIAKLIAHRYRRMTLFITTRGVLMYQMRDGFEDAGFKVGVIGDGIWTPTKGINVGMVQTIISQLKEPKLDEEIRAVVKSTSKKGQEFKREQIVQMAKAKYDEKIKTRLRIIKLLEMVEVVIGEEAHEAGGNSYYEILKHCKNAMVRVALTATPFMKSDAEDNKRLMAAFGPILIKVSEKTLIDRGILAKPIFQFANPLPNPKLRRTSPWQRAYDLGITDAPFRNKAIVAAVAKAKRYGLPSLVLVQRTAHGDLLKDMMDKLGIRVEFIRGEDDQKGRKRALDALAAGDIDCLIGTTILDVGVDVPAICLVILAGGGKAEVALRQRIGRGLRAKKKGPNVTFVLDFSDDVNSHLRDHARQRRAIIEATEGFNENILPAGKDFPWELFEKSQDESAIT
jgi:superfamily II DNA or RNA helicase